MKDKKHVVKASLNPELYRKFIEVKEALGLKSSENVVCYLVASEYERVTESGMVVIPFNKEDMRDLSEWSERLGVTPSEFVEQTIQEHVEKKA